MSQNLEAELGVQVLDTAGILGAAVKVAGLERLLESLAGVLAGVKPLHSSGVDVLLDVHDVVGHGVAGGHDVVVVDELDEGLHARTLEDLLLAHALGDGQGSLVNASDEAMAKAALRSSLIELLDDDGLATGVAASKDDHDLSGLDEFSHCASVLASFLFPSCLQLHQDFSQGES